MDAPSLTRTVNNADPADCATLLAQALDETALVAKRCGGSFAELSPRILAVAGGERTKVVMSTCKITDAPEKDPSKLNALSLLMATILSDELGADPASNPEEKQLAKMVAYTCPAK